MTLQVQFTAQARLEFFQAALWWAEHHDIAQAASWIENFEAAIRQLRANPERHPRIHEQDAHHWHYTYRRILFGLGNKPTHRAIYRIHNDRVYVVTVRHLHQADLLPDDLEQSDKPD